jgi:hypothetical protein
MEPLILAMALTAADWGQTRYISTHPSYYELNPILGRHPSLGRVNGYFLLGEAMLPVARYALPDKWGTRVMYATIAVEAGWVGKNARIGIKFNF